MRQAIIKFLKDKWFMKFKTFPEMIWGNIIKNTIRLYYR